MSDVEDWGHHDCEVCNEARALAADHSHELVDPIRALRERIEKDQPDTADGAALRRLREALGNHKVWTVMRHYNYDTIDHYPVVIDAEDFDWRVRGKGATIAEAADKCREALEGRT